MVKNLHNWLAPDSIFGCVLSGIFHKRRTHTLNEEGNMSSPLKRSKMLKEKFHFESRLQRLWRQRRRRQRLWRRQRQQLRLWRQQRQRRQKYVHRWRWQQLLQHWRHWLVSWNFNKILKTTDLFRLQIFSHSPVNILIKYRPKKKFFCCARNNLNIKNVFKDTDSCKETIRLYYFLASLFRNML